MNSAHKLIEELNKGFQLYAQKFSKQFHLQIPKNTLNTVQFYREQYFPYLKNSVFKSNICYLMQLLDYQIWLYKVFKPGLSLENAYFYQMLMTIGIITEALSTSILMNPLIIENEKDTSLGSVSKDFDLLHLQIVKNNFQNNIKLLEKFNILDNNLITNFSEFRIEIRNLIHIQNWEGRLYQQLSLEKFSEYLEKFREFLDNVKKQIKINHSIKELNIEFFKFHGESTSEIYSGTIDQYYRDKGYGFVECAEFERQIYFHISNAKLKPDLTVHVGKKIKFHLIMGKKGIEAALEI